jgi:Na+/H+ antiporter NhaD/arsenite permease-like protein
MKIIKLAAVPVMFLLPVLARAEELNMDGATLSPLWGIPFAGLLLSIALWPLLGPNFWHHHFGKIAAAWALAFLVPFALSGGLGAAGAVTAHAAIEEYLPFIILLTALYTVAGGIHIRGNLHGAPGLNAGILALGAVLASFMGTTGASMLMVRPLIRANDNRKHTAHIIIFFIFIVSNAGGSLTPLGDPPLFLGFLQGVGFFWTVGHLLPETGFLIAVLLAIFFFIDRHYYKKEGVLPVDPTPDTHPGIRFDGKLNFVLLAGVVCFVLLSGFWKSDIVLSLFGVPTSLPGVVRDVGLVAIALISWFATPSSVHADNRFTWGPMAEVAKLFAGIFLTIAPVIAMLQAGVDGPFGAVVSAVTRADGSPHPAAYFWATGLLSSFLDNAPTYLVFFNTAGGNAATLMSTHAATLAAISAGAVFMGANSYIGNAPNLMVKAIAEDRGIVMPSFFGYMAWSVGILVPIFLLMTFIWF